MSIPIDQTEELVQEIMLCVWEKSPRFDPQKGQAHTWIYTIATRLILNWRNKNCQKQARSETAGNDPAIENTIGPANTEETVLQGLDAQQALKALQVLPELMRDALVLRFLEHLSTAEVAEILECPPGTVKSRIFHGLKKMRIILAKENQ